MRRLPAHLENVIVTETVGHTNAIDVYTIDTYFLTDVFLKVIDCLLGELKKQFSITSNAVMRGIQCLNPKSKTFLDITIFQIARYGDEI